ncbi:MAG: ATP-binding protein [Methanospirillaceae archaeon]|nr:ATP-binding protein [Methanospirillaceae archaeon]
MWELTDVIRGYNQKNEIYPFLVSSPKKIRELCHIAGFTDTVLSNLELASEEAFVNILEHAYPDCKPGDIHIKGTITSTEMVLSFHDEEIPFHESPYEYSYAIDSDVDIDTRGLGFQIIRYSVDEVWFENLGKQGKVLFQVKKLPDQQNQYRFRRNM